MSRNERVLDQESGGPSLIGTVPAAIVLHHPDIALLDAQLTALTTGGRRLIFFANGSLHETIETRLAQLENAVILRSPGNVGLGEGLNAVVRQAADEKFEHLLLLDQDSAPTEDLPERLHERLMRESARGAPVAVIGPRLIPPAGEHYRAIRYRWRDRASGIAVFTPTSGSLISLAAFAAVGPFRSDYFIDCIDVEWCLRAGCSGYRSIVASDLVMPHRWGAQADNSRTPQILRQSPLRNYYYLRNMLDCWRRTPGPPAWRVRQGVTLAAQIAGVAVLRVADPTMRRALVLALRDGLSGRLGVAPKDL